MSDLVDTTTIKDAFAFHLLLTNNDVIASAIAVAPDNINFRLQITKYWPNDTYVLTKKAALLAEHGEQFFLPSKYDIARKYMEIAERAQHAEDRLKALQRYTELMGMVDRAGSVSVNNNHVTVNKVMIVERHGDDDEWEQQAKLQQARLTLDHAPTD